MLTCSCLPCWVTHICISKLTIIGSDNGLLLSRHQAIIWTNAGILLIWTLETNFSAILHGIHTFPFKKMHLKISSGKLQPFVSASMFQGWISTSCGISVARDNSLWPSDTVWRHRPWSTLVEVMESYLFSTKPLPEPMLPYCKLIRRNKFQWNMISWASFRKMHLKMLSAKYLPFCLGLNLLTHLLLKLEYSRIISQYHGCWCPGS